MAFTPTGVQYNPLAASWLLELRVDSETPTLAQFDAAATAFFDELHAQGAGPSQVDRTVLGAETTSGWWTAP